MLLVEQNASRALGLSDRGYVMDSGEVTMSGNAKVLLKDPKVRAAGACQASRRLIHAAIGCLSSGFEWSATTESRSGLRVTGPIGVQSRVVPDHRAGLRSRALM